LPPVDLKKRADKLHKILSEAQTASYDNPKDDKSIKSQVADLSPAEAKTLRSIYQQDFKRDLLIDLNKLPMEDKFRAFEKLAPEQIKPKTEANAGGIGINTRSI
jgi:hypothetical protein